MDMNETKKSISSDTDNNTAINSAIDNKINTEDLNSQDRISDIGSPEESETSPKSKRIPLTIRCPFTTTDLNIYIDPSHNVLHLKKKIYKEFPSNPKPSDQRLIFGGKIIQNNEILNDILKRQFRDFDISTPPIIHLIINSLAIQHAKTVKPRSNNNSENLSVNNTPSSSIQNSPTQSKQNINDNTNLTKKVEINETTNSSNNSEVNSNIIIDNASLSSPLDVNSENTKEVDVSSEIKISNSSGYHGSSLLKSDSSTKFSPNGVQYILLNNVIYAVQPASDCLLPGEISKAHASVDFRSNTDSDEIFENNNSNNINNNNNGHQVIDNNNNNNNNNNNDNNNNNNNNNNINNNNVQQGILNQILNENNEQQRQQPNQFFLFIRLAFIVYLLTQGGGYIRMFIVTFIAIIIFLVQTGRISVTIINYRNLPGVNNIDNNNNNNNNNNNIANQNEQNNNNNANGNNNVINEAGNNENEPLLNNNNDNNNNDNNNNNNSNNNNGNNNPGNIVPQYSFLANCRRVFFAFFLSLIPFIQDVA